MTLSVLGLANVVLAPLTLGLAFGRFAVPRTDRLFAVAYAQLAGSLALAGLYFIWLLSGLSPESFRYVPVPLGCMLMFAACMITRIESPVQVHYKSTRRSLGLAIAIVLGLAFVVDHALHGSQTLVMIGDEANIWAGKAKAIWCEGGFNIGFAHRVTTDPSLVHQDYPLLNPLSQLFTFASAGGILHVGNRIPVFACVVAIVLMVASSLRRAASSTVAIVGVLLVAGCGGIIEECENAAADGLVGLGLLAALECHARARTGGNRWLPALGIALAFLAWSKNEGVMLALCVAAGIVVDNCTRKRRIGTLPLIGAFIPFIFVTIVHFGFNAHIGVSNDLIGNPDAKPFLERVVSHAAAYAPAVARSAFEHGVRDLQLTNGLVLAFVAVVLLLPHVAWGRARAGVVAITLGMCGFFIVYLGTSRDLDWHLRWSMERILFQLTPACALVVVTICAGALTGRSRKGALPST